MIELAELPETKLQEGLGRSVAGEAGEPLLDDPNFFLSALLDQMQGGVYFKDRQGRFILINQTQAKALKLASPRDAVGKSDFDFFTQEHAGPAFADEQEIMRTGRALRDKEEKETWPDGRITWVSTTKMPLVTRDGRILGTFGFSRDVTESRQMRKRSLRARRTWCQHLNS